LKKKNSLIITRKEWRFILENREKKNFFVDINFGKRRIKVEIKNNKIILEERFHLDSSLKLKEGFCYLVRKKGIYPCAFFSSDTNRFYKLLPTSDWPTVLVSSTPMHRVSSPYKDSLRKIQLLKPYGTVLDTCMGLGYTAILAAEKAEKVVTFEVDKNIILLAKINPLSEALFTHPKVKIYFKDVYKYVERFSSDSFDAIIHDPPTFKLAPSLYEERFYRNLFSVLRKKGRLYHYLPLWGIKRGKDFPRKIKEKLEKTGFKAKIYLPQEGHLICVK